MDEIRKALEEKSRRDFCVARPWDWEVLHWADLLGCGSEDKPVKKEMATAAGAAGDENQPLVNPHFVPKA